MSINLTSALLKQIITQEDFDTWGSLRENYLPAEYQAIHRTISTHLKNFNQLPTFEDLKLSIRDRKLQEKVFAIEAVEVDVDAWILLEYLKNELTFDGQKGSNMNFRKNGQLRQLILLVENDKIITEAPVRGVAKPPTLDSLGILDCKN